MLLCPSSSWVGACFDQLLEGKRQIKDRSTYNYCISE